jgi:hypothetical protein
MAHRLIRSLLFVISRNTYNFRVGTSSHSTLLDVSAIFTSARSVQHEATMPA